MKHSNTCVDVSPSAVLHIAIPPDAMMHTNASVSRSSNAFGSRQVFVQTVRHELAVWVHQVINRPKKQCMPLGVERLKD